MKWSSLSPTEKVSFKMPGKSEQLMYALPANTDNSADPAHINYSYQRDHQDTQFSLSSAAA